MDKAPPKIGRYLVLRTLGRGALGTVYLANDPLIDRAVAVKVLGEWFDSDEGRERFIREARAAARLMHRNIVTIFDVADHEGQLFIAMEYIQGQTLRELIGRQQTVALTRKLEIVEDLCSALAYAHKQGVVHRDIRPTNVMVDEEGVVKVLDFGISRIAGSGMTRQGALIGSLNYMSPEQVTGSLVDQRSDVFAIGALFYELLSYRKAFEGNFQARHEIIYDDPRPLAELSPDVDGEIISIVARALEKDPDRRYQDLSQMRNDIARARRLTPGGRSDTTSVIEPGSVAAESGRREARELARRRIANISESLNKAEGAFEAGDLEAAFAECEHALLLDPDHPRALQLLERVRNAFDERQIRAMVSQARQLLDQGAIDAASQLADEAIALDPASKEAASLARDLRTRRRELELTAERGRRVERIFERARAALHESDYASAVQAAEEALAIDPGHASAGALRAQALAALAERRRNQEHERRAHEVVEKALQRFANGDHTAAFAMLESFTPTHARVTDTLGELRAKKKAEAIERENEARERARRSFDLIRTAERNPNYAALEILREAQRIDPQNERIGVLITERQAAIELERQDQQRASSVAERTVLPAAAPSDTPAKASPEESALSSFGTGIWALATGIAALPLLVAGGVKTAAETLSRAVSRRRSQAKSRRLPARDQPRRSAEPVLLGVSAPRRANPRTTFTARFIAYVKEREAVVKEQLRQLDADAVRGSVQTVMGLPPDRGGRWTIGAPVSVRLTGEGLQVDPDVRTFEWNGAENIVSFLVSVPESAPHGIRQLCFEAFIEGVPVAFVPLNLSIGSETSGREAVTITARPLSSAFASYASNDAPTVALLLSALKRWDPHADVFMDCLDLTPNEDWRHELEKVIPTKDAFLLFWSTSASKSPSVAWELQHARSTKGLEWIRPMPIDDPETAPPPDFLQHLHFRDKYLTARQAFLQLKGRQPT